jgi:two-component system, OmpR family, sensor kinase
VLGEYRTLLVGFLLSLLLVTLSVSFLGWRGAARAADATTRARVAHEVLDGLLRVRVDANRLLTDLTVAALAGGDDGLTEGKAQERIRADLLLVREGIAQELALLEARDDRAEEARELEQLRKVELSIDAVVGEFDAVARLLAVGRREEAAQRIRTAVDKQGDGSGVAGNFRSAIQAAIDEEEHDVKLADASASAALAASARAMEGAALAALVLAGFGLVVLLKRLQQPLKRLSASARAVAGGDITSRVSIHGNDEFARVGRVINGMLDELEANRRKLQLAHAQLEATVAERTSELSAANEALREVDTVRRRFLADISHELRTPLTIIRGEGEVALRGREKDPAEYRTTLVRIVEQAGHTARLVDDLLFIARSGADQFRMSHQPVPFDELVRRSCADAQSLGQAKGISIEFRQDVQRAILQGDPGRLRQLVHILLDNACLYGHPHSRVEVTLAPRPAGVALIVADQGCGIPQDEVPHIFERFYRGSNAAERHRDGSGLGLSMARAIVEAHGGSIALQAAVDVGTTVTVDLPAIRELRLVDGLSAA